LDPSTEEKNNNKPIKEYEELHFTYKTKKWIHSHPMRRPLILNVDCKEAYS